jgi:hypothetical protein
MRKAIFLLTLLVLCSVSSAHMENKPVKSKVLAFVADTQAPMWIEGVFLRKDNNPEATKKVMQDILQRQPATLFMLGDVVSLGMSKRAWITIDYFLKQFTTSNIPVYALMGNHELMQRPAKGEKNFQEYFPAHKRTGYYEVTDSIAVLLMNSNVGSLDGKELQTQFDWYNKTLKELDQDKSIKAVIVTCHHSPFTNSKLVSPNHFVQETFVPGFIKSKKAILFLSGHAHRFEYFRFQDKDFLVIGGGGGLGHPARKGGVRFPDLAPDYKPAFHYLTVERNNDSLHVQSHGLRKDFSGFEDGFKLDYKLTGD